MMVRRSRAEKVNAKQKKAEKKAAKKAERKAEKKAAKSSKKKSEDARKGMGKRAQETIRRGHPEPQKPKRAAGPPIKTSTASTRKQITGITPEQVVSTIRGGKR